MDQNRRVRILDVRIADAKLTNIVTTESKHLICSCKKSGMVIATGQLLYDNVKAERVWNVISFLFHFFISLRFILLCDAELSVLVAAPREELSVLGPFTLFFVLNEREA